MGADRCIYSVGDSQRCLQDIEMAIGQRVEGAGIKGGAFGHGRLLASLSNKGKSSFEPFRRHERQMNAIITNASRSVH
jgi:hypothetical protein